MEGRERLTNLDVEMGSVEKKKVRRSPDRQRILDSEEELSERGWSDEDENMNNNENAKKAPTSKLFDLFIVKLTSTNFVLSVMFTFKSAGSVLRTCALLWRSREEAYLWWSETSRLTFG